MTNRTKRKVAWSNERMCAYVTREGVRYWAPEETCMCHGDDVEVLNPTVHSVTVKGAGVRETWCADATSNPEPR